MARIFILSGASDDLVELEGTFTEEWDVYTDEDLIDWTATIKRPNGRGIGVAAFYTDAGTWAMAAFPLDDAVPMPTWPITIDQHPDTDYSSRLTVAAPDDAVLTVHGARLGQVRRVPA